MSRDIFPEPTTLPFYSPKPLTYGDLITIVSKPEKQNGEWTAVALISDDEQVEIRLSREIVERSFIILRSKKLREEEFLHYAISLELLTKTVHVIEGNILELLQTRDEFEQRLLSLEGSRILWRGVVISLVIAVSSVVGLAHGFNIGLPGLYLAISAFLVHMYERWLITGHSKINPRYIAASIVGSLGLAISTLIAILT